MANLNGVEPTNAVNSISKDSVKKKEYDIIRDGIKHYLNYEKNIYSSFLDDRGLFTKKEKLQMVVDSIYTEDNDFYNTNFRTSTLRTIIKKVSSRVVDDVKFTLDDEEIDVIKIPVINQYNQVVYIDYDLNVSDFNEISKKFLLYSEVCLLGNIVGGKFVFKIVDPFKILKSGDMYTYTYFNEYGEKCLENRDPERITTEIKKTGDNGEEISEITETRNPFGRPMVFTIKKDDTFIERGTLELIMMRSFLYNTTTKESALTAIQLFIDKGYIGSDNILNLNRGSYVPLNSLNLRTDAGDANRPIYEEFSPQIRANDLVTLDNNIVKEISRSLNLDSSTIGFDTNGDTKAVEVRSHINDSENNINTLKLELELKLNKFLRELTNNDYFKISIPEYKVISQEQQMSITNSAISNGYMTILTAVKRLNPEWSEDEQKVEAYKLMRQKMIDFTDDELEDAIRLGIVNTRKQTEGDYGEIL